jgi:hypothetical protein
VSALGAGVSEGRFGRAESKKSSFHTGSGCVKRTEDDAGVWKYQVIRVAVNYLRTKHGATAVLVLCANMCTGELEDWTEDSVGLLSEYSIRQDVAVPSEEGETIEVDLPPTWEILKPKVVNKAPSRRTPVQPAPSRSTLLRYSHRTI